MTLTIACITIDSPLGNLFLGATENGLALVSNPSQNTLAKCEATFLATYPGAVQTAQLPVLAETARQLTEYFAGNRTVFSLPLDMSRGTAFQHTIWQKIARIPYGQAISYTQLAERAGRPKAIRAAAHGCATNPLPLVVPCHRVLAKDGSLGGFAWGLAAKKYLLGLETRQTLQDAA